MKDRGEAGGSPQSSVCVHSDPLSPQMSKISPKCPATGLKWAGFGQPKEVGGPLIEGHVNNDNLLHGFGTCIERCSALPCSPEDNLPLGCSNWQQVNWKLPCGVCILLSTFKGAGKSCLEQGLLACVLCLYVIRCASEL